MSEAMESLGPHGEGSFWIESSGTTSYPRLEGDLTADVAVVGGGIAGLCAAWELLRAGRSVVLLEARRIVTGVTGHTTGRVSALHPYLYRPLVKSLGTDGARLYARSQQDAVEHLVRTTTELGIDCALERRPSHLFVEADDEVADLRDEGEAAREAGLEAKFVDRIGLPFETAGALRLEGQIQFHPRRYLLGLAEAFVREGGRIYEQTRVVDLDEDGPCTLTTDGDARVRADDVVLATLFPVFGRPTLDTRLSALRELVVTAPMPPDQDLDGMYITREHGTRSVRTAPYRDGRLLLVTGESFSPGSGDAAERYARLAGWARDAFGVTEFTHRWSAQDTKTTDQIPFVGRRPGGSDHVYVTTGYARSGMSHAIMSSRLIAGLVAGRSPEWAELYDPRRVHPAREARPLLGAAASVARHLVADRAVTGSAADIPPGGGGVVRMGGEPCAVYRGEDGVARAVSAVCPHMRCVVAFNDVDRTWECPCHGSRFALDGTVLDGPARRPLEKRPIDE
ncbi:MULTISPECIES: FAD-dependent oxidoreductase [Actinomadura]|uniref:FAD-dependent oxidoreductase n=1 Tax=Actinomadura yumaensis TaxID=111807 RepID=A0ABW2CWS6_9ACTN|nr:FAD-dependent oxidoreductase [Actinomadura sp. J1-007]